MVVPSARRVVDTGLMSPPPARARRDSGGVNGGFVFPLRSAITAVRERHAWSGMVRDAEVWHAEGDAEE